MIFFNESRTSKENQNQKFLILHKTKFLKKKIKRFVFLRILSIHLVIAQGILLFKADLAWRKNKLELQSSNEKFYISYFKYSNFLFIFDTCITSHYVLAVVKLIILITKFFARILNGMLTWSLINHLIFLYSSFTLSKRTLLNEPMFA